MKKLLFVCLMSLFWGSGIMAPEVKAQYVYYYTDVHYDSFYRYVDGYTTTYLDYYSGFYYDPAVLGELYRMDMNETPLDAGYDEGYADIFPAEVYLFTWNYVEGRTYCTAGTHFVIDAYTGWRSVVARLYPCITIPYSPTPTPTVTPTPTPTITPTPTPASTPTVISVTFEQIHPSTEPISQNPQVSPHNPGIGLRIFPDDDYPQDPVDRQRIRVIATLSQPVPNVQVYFRNFDLDDPATDPIIDPMGNAGNDNNGTPLAGTLSACTATSNGCWASTNASGIAAVEFTVTRQPGDNFAIAAGVNPNEVGAVNMSGIDLINGSGQPIPTSCTTEHVCRSQMLTVWRRLHIEVDSMGESVQNFVLGNIATGMKVRRFQTVTFNVNTTNLLEENRFENGRMTIGNDPFEVVSNTATTVTATYRRFYSVVSISTGEIFTLYDDDDFNDDDGPPPGDGTLDGDTGEDITEPDTSLLTPNSDDPNTNVFATAYVRPVYDISDPRDNSFFQANTFGDFETEIRPLFRDWDSSNTNRADEFWSIYLLGSYQHTLDADNDPSTESAVRGIVDAITGDTSGGSDGEGSGALIFKEVLRTREIDDPSPYVNERHTVAHEAGHLFSGQHTDGELMGVPRTSSNFSNITIRKIRGLPHP